MTKIKIATRKSQLALWQANTVKGILEAKGFSVALHPLTTSGDKLQSGALSEKSVSDAYTHLTTGKGLFVREIQHALLNGEADVAVHSMKDLPVTLTPGLHVPALLPRADVRDALVLSPRLIDWLHQKGVTDWGNMPFQKLCDVLRTCPLLRDGQGMGTTSARRQMWTKKFFGEGIIVNVLRGNVDTRLMRVRQNDFAAILLAKAGLDRLQLYSSADMYPLPETHFVPAPAQGVIAIEIPDTRSQVGRALAAMNEPQTVLAAAMERWALTCVGGDCHTAVALHYSAADVLHVGWQKDAQHARVLAIDLSLFKSSLSELLQKHAQVSYSTLAAAFEKSHAARFIYDSLKTHGIAVVDGLCVE